jgi:ribosome-associated translation inhibitor RaiA
MQIPLNTGKNIEGGEALAAHVETSVSKALSHLSGHVTRVEVHLSGENEHR